VAHGYKPESWWSQTLAGLLVIAGGVGLYFILSGQELAPDPDFKAPWPMVLLYSIGGKATVAALFFLVGGAVAVAGLWRKASDVARRYKRLNIERQQLQELTELVELGKSVEAMKLYREWTNASLNDAKETIERIRRTSRS